jgi:citrate lyase subunit beta-like protein
MEAFEAHQSSGQGAFVFEGRMIDAPTMLQARNVLRLSARLRPKAD